MLKFFMHLQLTVDAVQLQLRWRYPRFSLSLFFSLYPSLHGRSIISRPISPDLSRALRVLCISYGCVASLPPSLSSSSFFFYCHDSLWSSPLTLRRSTSQSDISILELHLNDVTPVPLIALPSPLLPAVFLFPFSISFRVTLDFPIFSLHERR